ncbi:hypothetical protein [Pedobacter psychrodurus]|uniref:hypothetical protein n=1 Tax=Pedobacter psychrodurus TaxID=2530456 RepID=UPI00292D15B9|nr:hypothetical protein [Pedobacter psychrodurus]
MGKFYTIYGVDDSASLESHDDQFIKHYYAINAITVSPYKEFEQPFKKEIELIEEFYPDYKFVPFAVHSMVIDGLKVRYSDKEVCSVYDALFNGNLGYYNDSTFHRGDTRYGYDGHWRINDHGNQNASVKFFSPPIIK